MPVTRDPVSGFAEDVVRRLPGPGIRRRTEVGKIDADHTAIGDAAAKRFDPAAVPGPDLLDRPGKVNSAGLWLDYRPTQSSACY